MVVALHLLYISWKSVNILTEFLHQIFIKGIDDLWWYWPTRYWPRVFLFFLINLLVWLDFRILLSPQNESGSGPSAPVFCKTLYRVNIINFWFSLEVTPFSSCYLTFEGHWSLSVELASVVDMLLLRFFFHLLWDFIFYFTQVITYLLYSFIFVLMPRVYFNDAIHVLC